MSNIGILRVADEQSAQKLIYFVKTKYWQYNPYLCISLKAKSRLKKVRTILLVVGTLYFMVGCPLKVASSKGIVSDTAMNTVTIVIDKNDTFSLSTIDVNRDEINGLFLNDTLEMLYTEKYIPGMPASKLVQYPQSPTVGGDRGERDCIDSAGCIRYEVQKDCIRLPGKGIRTESVDGSNASAFIMFNPDSTRPELFFSNNQPNEILERCGLSSGGYAWNVEDGDTKNVRLIDGLWTISQKNKLIYGRKAGN